MGNLDANIEANAVRSLERPQISNETVGLNGNVVLETTVGPRVSGIVYRCSNAPGTAK